MVEITNDLFDICWRLRAIDDNYRVKYNIKKKRYEVHNLSQPFNTLAFVVPYEQLDARTVQYALKTRVQNCKMLMEEMEKHNAQLEKDEQYKAFQQSMSKVENAARKM